MQSRVSDGSTARKRKGAETIFRRLLGAGYECYLVGGSVRDLMLGRAGADLDFATNARPSELLRLFRHSYYPNSFGTVLVIVDGVQYEVTTYRGEGRYSDHRHPDAIAFVDRLEEDLQRRDFTINAMAMDLEGRIVDPFGGREDLRRRLIRAVGDASERLAEDPLRMMRAARLAAQLCFSIEEQTWEAIRANAAKLALISRERVRDELLKLLASPHPLTGVDFLDHLRLLEDALPELAQIRRLNRAPELEFDLYQHALHSLRFAPADGLLRLAVLLHVLAEAAPSPPAPLPNVGEGSETAILGSYLSRALARLRLSKADEEYVTHAIAGLDAVPDDLPATEGQARRLLSAYGERLPDLLALVEAHRRGLGGAGGAGNLGQLQRLGRLADEAKRLGQPLTIGDLAISGADLMRELHLPQGREVGRLLRLLLERVLDDPSLNSRETLLRLAAEAHGEA